MAFWRKKKPTPEPIAAPVDVAPKQIKISYEALARAKHRERQAPILFTPAIHPPKATPAKMQIAQDEAIGGAQDWANAQIANDFGSIWSEGVTFLGYAFLSELAQRPEYRVMSETIATEMTRAGIRFTSTSDDDDDKSERIKELSAEFKRLDVIGMFRKATEQDGYFGRGHIYIDTGDGDDPSELRQSIGDGRDGRSKTKIGIGSIRALRTVEAVWCYPTNYNSNDPLADNWYRPDEWYVQSKIVHSSRLITLIGREVPDLLKPTYSFGGLSMSQMAKPYVDNWLQTRQSVTDIIDSFTTWVLKTDLSTSTQADGDQLFKRLSLFNLLRSNQSVMAINKDTEDFANVSAPLAGLGELKSLAQQDMASVSHIPLVKLTGITPAGLSASSEGEIRVFYDWISAFQEKLYRRPLHRLMGLIMLSLWGEIDDEIGFEFEPLWALDEAEAATAEKTRADTDVAYIESGVLSAEEVRQRLAADDHSGYTSIDVDDAPDLLDEEEHGLEPAGGRPDPAVTGDPGGGSGGGSGGDE